MYDCRNKKHPIPLPTSLELFLPISSTDFVFGFERVEDATCCHTVCREGMPALQERAKQHVSNRFEFQKLSNWFLKHFTQSPYMTKRRNWPITSDKGALYTPCRHNLVDVSKLPFEPNIRNLHAIFSNDSKNMWA